MADTSIPETPAQQQARLRREKREKKILEGGVSRLDKITRTSGRPADPGRPADDSAASGAARLQAQHHELPAATDSDDPLTTNPQGADAALRQFLRNPSPGPNPPSFSVTSHPVDQGEELSEDPMMRLLRQLVGASPPSAQPGQESSQSGGIPPEIAAALRGGSQTGSLGRPEASANVFVWKVLHAIFALALGIYVLSYGTSVASLSSSLQTALLSPPDELNVFWAFVTVELGLQAARYFLEGEKEMSGAAGMLAGVLTSPWKERLVLATRYTGIWTTLVEDAMVIIWLFGIAAWWNSSPN